MFNTSMTILYSFYTQLQKYCPPWKWSFDLWKKSSFYRLSGFSPNIFFIYLFSGIFVFFFFCSQVSRGFHNERHTTRVLQRRSRTKKCNERRTRRTSSSIRVRPSGSPLEVGFKPKTLWLQYHCTTVAHWSRNYRCGEILQTISITVNKYRGEDSGIGSLQHNVCYIYSSCQNWVPTEQQPESSGSSTKEKHWDGESTE